MEAHCSVAARRSTENLPKSQSTQKFPGTDSSHSQNAVCFPSQHMAYSKLLTECVLYMIAVTGCRGLIC